MRREQVSRYGQAASSVTPLQDLRGSITPSALHFERHHAGIPEIDPSEHRLLVDGLVDRPLVFTMDEIERLPAVTHIYFVECSGNTRVKWSPAQQDTDAQTAFGMTSCSEWTGVPLSVLLREAGVSSEGRWLVAEGADACRMTRSVPLEKAIDDALIAFGQNGEALRPAQGYPLRLLLPGWEGNTSIKWLRRIQVVDQPYMTREETSKYTRPDAERRGASVHLRDGCQVCHHASVRWTAARLTRFLPDLWLGLVRTRARPSCRGLHGMGDGRGSRRSCRTRFLPLAHTRFRFDWTWDGTEITLASRCIDEAGNVQPTRDALIAARGTQSSYHNNAIQGWKIRPDGRVENVDV